MIEHASLIDDEGAAQLIGWDKDLGSIKVGKYADIIAVQGDPLAHIELLKDVKAVMKGGVVVKEN